MNGYIWNDKQNKCVNTNTDSQCCSASCVVCIEGQVCENGLCVCPRGLDLNKDASKCTDRNIDPQCCGDECITCKDPYCVGGICETKCDEDQVLCDSRCLNKADYHVKETGILGVCACDNYCDDDDNPNNGCLGKSFDELEANYQIDCNTCMEGMKQCQDPSGKLYCVNLTAMNMVDCDQCADNWMTENLEDYSKGCMIDLLHDKNNCGRPNYKCSVNMIHVAEEIIFCNNGVCDYFRTCSEQSLYQQDSPTEEQFTRDDCDEDRSNGCETTFREGYTAHCGSCGNACKAGQVCKIESNALRCCFEDGSGCTGENCLKKEECCNGNNLYRRCSGILCMTMMSDTYMCASSVPDGYWRKE